MSILKIKLKTLHDILACSEKQAGMLLASGEELDPDALMAIADEKQHLIQKLAEMEEEIQTVLAGEDPAHERLREEIAEILNQITKMDTANIEKVQNEMGNLRKEIKGTRERIKVNTAYQTILGREKNPSSRLDIRDGRRS